MAPGRSKQSALSLFGGVPLMIVHDRTKTAGRRHVVPEGTVPLHPEAVVLAGNLDHLAVNAPSPAPLWRPVRQQPLHQHPLRVGQRHTGPPIR